MLNREAAIEILRRQPAGSETRRFWPCRIGPLTVYFPNFRWRRDAILAHDLHHLMTGYPMTMRGEFQMAAWELGAGRYRHWGATLFCSPLLFTGLLWSPLRMIEAYRAGRATSSLYRERAGQAQLGKTNISTP